MRYSTQIKPISYLKANAAEVERGEITPIGEVVRRLRSKATTR
jgi:hypothetical protein